MKDEIEFGNKLKQFDRKGNSIDLMTWADLIEDDKYREVKQTKIKDYFISTIWLGLDHSYFGIIPHIFETIVFKKNKQLEMERYPTEEEAIDDHDKICEKYRKAK